MKTLSLLMIFMLISGFCLGQQKKKTESHVESIYLEGQVGINRVESLLQSSRYFNNYKASGEVSPFFALDAVFRFRSNLVFQSGIKYLTHNTKTDSLNIPPVGRDDIWSKAIFAAAPTLNCLGGTTPILRTLFKLAIFLKKVFW